MEKHQLEEPKFNSIKERTAWIYNSEDKQTLRKNYNLWSSTYDTELEYYSGSLVKPAEALEKVLPNKNANILDAGAGTGQVGVALSQLGYSQITGIDISENMLAVAQKKQVYTTLHRADMEEPLTFFTPETFDGIIIVGVITYGHVHPFALQNLFSLLKPGGYLVLTVRKDYQKDNPSLEDIIGKLSWSLLSQEEFLFPKTNQIMNILTLMKD